MAARSALIAGASGLVGSHLLKLLLADPGYAKVVALVRSELRFEHEKLVQNKVDFNRLSETLSCDGIDDVYCCLGTTMKKAGSKEAFKRVDLDYPKDLAEAVNKSASHFIVVSALGANPGSSVFYNRVKGDMERAIQKSCIPFVTILRPSLLLGEREEGRPLEAAGIGLMKVAKPLFRGSLRKYAGVSADAVAAAMLSQAHAVVDGSRTVSRLIVESDEI